jgi:hypothetical protein
MLKLMEPSGLVMTCNGIALPLPLHKILYFILFPVRPATDIQDSQVDSLHCWPRALC